MSKQWRLGGYYETIVITGATSGIGLESAKLLAKKGYRILGVGRSGKRCAKAREEILAGNKGADVAFFTADLMQQREALRAARRDHRIITKTAGESCTR
jgi:short-subunit dehydrogenase